MEQITFWQNNEGNWEYFFHGNGCLLTHQMTGEVIDWDAPNVKVFDSWKFIYWLEWVIETKPNDLVRDVDGLQTFIASKNELESVVNDVIAGLIMQSIIARVPHEGFTFTTP